MKGEPESTQNKERGMLSPDGFQEPPYPPPGHHLLRLHLQYVVQVQDRVEQEGQQQVAAAAAAAE